MSSTKEDLPQEVRLYIGAISQDLYDSCDELISRLLRFGKLLSELEIHQKPTSITYFAYINIEIAPKNLVKLKQHLQGVKFKNSKLIIDILKKTFDKVWEEDQNRPDSKEEDRLKREKIALRRQERILFGKDELVIKGRIRKTSRKNLKNLTLRCFLNGKPISFKKNKTKVWGYDKNKKLRDLTWVFDKNSWKDGNFHIVEKVSSSRVPDLIEETEIEEEVFEIEKETNNKILSSLFQNFDFDKPMEFKEVEKEEESGESDYEFELNFKNTDEYDVKLKKCDQSVDVIEEYKKSNPLPALNDEMDVDSSEELEQEEEEEIENERDVDALSKEDAVDDFKESAIEKSDVEDDTAQEVAEQDSDVDDEFVPIFGKKNDTADTNDTEKLRSLFNPTESTSFKLQDTDVEEDGLNEIEIDKEEILQQQLEKKQILNQFTNKSLFFTHVDSPFLLTQSQLNKISKEFNKSEFETWFYEKRGELNRDFKRYKRDFVRQFNKKK